VRITQSIPAALTLAALVLSGCTSGQTTSPSVSAGANPVTQGTLQLAVGTANIAGAAALGLNVVTTYRQPSGQTAALFTTPTLTLAPGSAFTVAAAPASAVTATTGATWSVGPSAGEVAGGFIGGSAPSLLIPPNQASGTFDPSNYTSLGLWGGVTANGLMQSNSNQQGSISTSVPSIRTTTSLSPYPQPFYVATGATKFSPWAGPPLFAGPNGKGSRDGTFETGTPAGTNGIRGLVEDITAFGGVTPAAGTYTLAALVPTGFVGTTPTNATINATATLGNVALVVGIATAPAVTINSDGSAAFTLALPANATGALVQIIDYGTGTAATPGSNCYQADVPTVAGTFQPPAYFTLNVTTSGTQTIATGLGPASVGKTAPTFCTSVANTAALAKTSPGDTFTVQVIGYDYPLGTFEYPINTSAKPAIVGGAGQADISIGAISTQNAP
jgi:hypothetical protein